jgi:uncharacterized protein (TIGR02246 family)
LTFAACDTQPAEVQEEAIDLNSLRTEIQAMEDAYAEAQMAKDAEGVVVYYAGDAKSLPPNRPVAEGKDAILALTREQLAADTTTSSVRFEVVDLFAQGNLAVEVGRSITTETDGSQSTGKYLSVFEKRDGKWICIRDIYNDDAPEASDQ